MSILQLKQLFKSYAPTLYNHHAWHAIHNYCRAIAPEMWKIGKRYAIVFFGIQRAAKYLRDMIF
jgi:hypothetical protein